MLFFICHSSSTAEIATLSTGAIVGIAIAIAVVVCLLIAVIVVVVVFIVKWPKRKLAGDGAKEEEVR